MAPAGNAEREHLDSLLRESDRTQDVIGELAAEVGDGSDKLILEQLISLVPRVARGLNVAEAVFPRDALEVYLQRFDFDGSGNLSAAETAKLFLRCIRRYRIDVFGPEIEVAVPRATPKEAGYTFVRDLGAGGQGAMKLYKDREGQFRCIKFYDKSKGNAGNIDDVKDEYALMKSIYSPHLAQTYEVFQDATFFYLVNEPYFGGDLRSFVRNASAQGVAVSEALWRSVFGQAITGLSHLHRNAVMHCDIKEPNIMIAEKDYHNPRVVLIDFGLATAFTGSATHVGGTPGYMPPETLDTMVWYPKGDVWSMGIVMFQLLAGKVPDPPVVNGIFQEGLIHAALQGIDPMDWIAKNTKEEDPPWDLLPKEMPLIHDLLRHMLQKPMALRVAVHQCLQHPWLRQSDTNAPCDPVVLRALADIGHRSAAQEAAIELLIGRLSMAELGSLRDCFDAADMDRTGFLEPKEVTDLLHRCGIPENAHGIILRALVGQEGRVSYQRFVHELLAKKALSDAQRLRELFDDLDIQKRGGLEIEVLQHMLQQECAEPSQAEGLIAAMDVNHDGLVSFEELRRVIIDGRPPAELDPDVSDEPPLSYLGMASRSRNTVQSGSDTSNAAAAQLVENLDVQQGAACSGLQGSSSSASVLGPSGFDVAAAALGGADAGAGRLEDDAAAAQTHAPSLPEPAQEQRGSGSVDSGAVAESPVALLPPPLCTQPLTQAHPCSEDVGQCQPEPEWSEPVGSRLHGDTQPPGPQAHEGNPRPGSGLDDNEASQAFQPFIQASPSTAFAPTRPPARTEEEPFPEADCVEQSPLDLDNSYDLGDTVRLESLSRMIGEMLPDIQHRESETWSNSQEDAPAFSAIGLQDPARIADQDKVPVPQAEKECLTPSTKSPESSENSTPVPLPRQPERAASAPPCAGASGHPSCLARPGPNGQKLRRRVSFSEEEEAMVYQVPAQAVPVLDLSNGWQGPAAFPPQAAVPRNSPHQSGVPGQKRQTPCAAQPLLETIPRLPMKPADNGRMEHETPGSKSPKLESLCSFLDNLLPSFNDGKLEKSGNEVEEEFPRYDVPAVPRKEEARESCKPLPRQSLRDLTGFDKGPRKPSMLKAGDCESEKLKTRGEFARESGAPVCVQRLSDFLASDEDQAKDDKAVAPGDDSRIQRRRNSALDNVVGKFLRKNSRDEVVRQFDPPQKQPQHLIPAVQLAQQRSRQQAQQRSEALAAKPAGGKKKAVFTMDERREGETMACLMDRLLPDLAK